VDLPIPFGPTTVKQKGQKKKKKDQRLDQKDENGQDCQINKYDKTFNPNECLIDHPNKMPVLNPKNYYIRIQQNAKFE